MYGGLKIKLGFCGFFAIIMAGVLGNITLVAKALGESQLTMPTAGRDSKDLVEQEKQLSSEFSAKVKLLGSYEYRKTKLVKKYISLSLELEKMQVVLHRLKSADLPVGTNDIENTLMLDHRKIVSERSFVFEHIREGFLRQYKLLENLETLQKSGALKERAPSDAREEIRWTKGELRRLEEMENWNWMLLKIRESLHYLRTDMTKELALLNKK